MNGMHLLVTGGAGSFARAFVHHAPEAPNGTRLITVFSRDERKHHEMSIALSHHSDRLRFVIGDMRDSRRVDEALLGVDYVVHAHYWETSTAETFLGFVDHLRGQVSQPQGTVLDNASIHRAKAIRPALALLEEQGVKFEFLSAYSPELNRIETMWRLMKHRWMEVKRRSKEELERTVDHIFEHFGSQFKMEF